MEDQPLLDDAPGLKSDGDFFEVDGLLFQGSPQPYDEDIVQLTPTPVIEMRTKGLGQRRDKGKSGAQTTLIRIMISGGPCLAMASSNVSTQQPTCIVLLSR